MSGEEGGAGNTLVFSSRLTKHGAKETITTSAGQGQQRGHALIVALTLCHYFADCNSQKQEKC